VSASRLLRSTHSHQRTDQQRARRSERRKRTGRSNGGGEEGRRGGGTAGGSAGGGRGGGGGAVADGDGVVGYAIEVGGVFCMKGSEKKREDRKGRDENAPKTLPFPTS
jgi:hypothetical protein